MICFKLLSFFVTSFDPTNNIMKQKYKFDIKSLPPPLKKEGVGLLTLNFGKRVIAKIHFYEFYQISFEKTKKATVLDFNF